MKIATAQDMKKIDETAVKDHGLTLAGLMENAGAAFVGALEEECRERVSKKTIGILCGPGNNGGDGLVAARILKATKKPAWSRWSWGKRESSRLK